MLLIESSFVDPGYVAVQGSIPLLRVIGSGQVEADIDVSYVFVHKGGLLDCLNIVHVAING